MIKVIAVEKINPGSNVRNENDSEIHDLAQSINEHGLLQPINVRKIDVDKYECISGHRRLAAVKLLGEPYIECVVMEDVNEKEKTIIQVVENIQRKNMSAYELVKVFDAMKKKYNCTNKQLARYFHKPNQWVYDTYTAYSILEREYKNGIPEEKKKLTAGQIKKSLNNKRVGEAKIIECNGFNVRQQGHSYLIKCSTFEAEQKLLEYIELNK